MSKVSEHIEEFKKSQDLAQANALVAAADAALGTGADVANILGEMSRSIEQLVTRAEKIAPGAPIVEVLRSSVESMATYQRRMAEANDDMRRNLLDFQESLQAARFDENSEPKA